MLEASWIFCSSNLAWYSLQSFPDQFYRMGTKKVACTRSSATHSGQFHRKGTKKAACTWSSATQSRQFYRKGTIRQPALGAVPTPPGQFHRNQKDSLHLAQCHKKGTIEASSTQGVPRILNSSTKRGPKRHPALRECHTSWTVPQIGNRRGIQHSRNAIHPEQFHRKASKEWFLRKPEKLKITFIYSELVHISDSLYLVRFTVNCICNTS